MAEMLAQQFHARHDLFSPNFGYSNYYPPPPPPPPPSLPRPFEPIPFGYYRPRPIISRPEIELLPPINRPDIYGPPVIPLKPSSTPVPVPPTTSAPASSPTLPLESTPQQPATSEPTLAPSSTATPVSISTDSTPVAVSTLIVPPSSTSIQSVVVESTSAPTTASAAEVSINAQSNVVESSSILTQPASTNVSSLASTPSALIETSGTSPTVASSTEPSISTPNSNVTGASGNLTAITESPQLKSIATEDSEENAITNEVSPFNGDSAQSELTPLEIRQADLPIEDLPKTTQNSDQPLPTTISQESNDTEADKTSSAEEVQQQQTQPIEANDFNTVTSLPDTVSDILNTQTTAAENAVVSVDANETPSSSTVVTTAPLEQTASDTAPDHSENS